MSSSEAGSLELASSPEFGGVVQGSSLLGLGKNAVAAKSNDLPRCCARGAGGADAMSSAVGVLYTKFGESGVPEKE